MYSLNLDTDNRILSVGECIEGMEYDIMVDSFPDDNVRDYKYINGEYIHDPEPKPDPPEPQPTLEERMDAAESSIDYLAMMTDIEIPTEV